MKFLSIRDMDLKGKRVLLRADLNVPARRGKVMDATRIDRLKPTIDLLRHAGARTLVLSHFGRPEGAQNPEMSLAFLIPALEKSWDCNIRFAQNCVGEKARILAANLKDGEVALLENVRFHKGEEDNDPAFIQELAILGDIFVNDAFSAAHRAHASTEGLAHYMPAAAGLLMEGELNALDAALGHPKKPVVAVTGGSKISTKLNVLRNLVEKVDYLILGGGMANTFSFARGDQIGSSLCEKDMAAQARDIMAHAEEKGCTILLPSDCVTVTELGVNAPFEIVSSDKIPEGRMAIDIGPASIREMQAVMTRCKTLVWNGPMGVFEIKPFDNGTNALAQTAAKLTREGKLTSIAGGGDTVAALENAEACSDFSYVSTAGGAFLEWLEGRELPGVAVLKKNLLL